MNTNFPEELNSRNLQARSATGLCEENQDNHIVAIVVCRGRHATGYPTEQGSASTPTAREGEKIPRIFQETRTDLHSPKASRQTAIVSLCTSHELLDRAITLAATENASRCPALQRPCRGGKPSGRRRSAWSSQCAARRVGGSHSLRITSVHHDRCRPEVAVA